MQVSDTSKSASSLCIIMNARFAGIQPELCNSFMNRRICSRSWRLAVRQLEGRIGADSAASYMELGRRASIHTHTHTVLSWPAASLQSTGHCATTTIGCAMRIPQPADLRLGDLSFDRPQLLSPLCLHRGMLGFTPHLHARPSTAGAAGRTLLLGLTTQPPQPLLECLSSIRPIFLNFVTFSTKHGSTSDKACTRLLGSCCVYAKARCWPRSHF